MTARALPRSLEDLRGRRAARWVRESTAGQADNFGPTPSPSSRPGQSSAGASWTRAPPGRSPTPGGRSRPPASGPRGSTARVRTGTSGASERASGGRSDFIPFRTRFFEDLIGDQAAVADQVVLLSAGLDTRALRLHLTAHLDWFEVDDADLLEDKEAALAAAGAEPRCRRLPARRADPVDRRGAVLLPDPADGRAPAPRHGGALGGGQRHRRGRQRDRPASAPGDGPAPWGARGSRCPRAVPHRRPRGALPVRRLGGRQAGGARAPGCWVRSATVSCARVRLARHAHRSDDAHVLLRRSGHARAPRACAPARFDDCPFEVMRPTQGTRPTEHGEKTSNRVPPP